jgi:MoaA/NifB/PqqE/SkfB family radical SAM enzyme
MQRIDVKLGFDCNNRCLFCVQGDKRQHYRPRPLAQIERDLLQGLQRGSVGLVLTGGEPTLQKTFLAVIRLARKLGYADVQVQTNGRSFSYEAFCRAAIGAGATEFSPALHGSTAEIHDRLTCAPGSFAQTVAGIRTLVGLGQLVVTNTVITSENYRDLPALAELLVSLRVKQYQFAFVHMVGSAEANKTWLVPHKSEVMPFVAAGLEVGKRAGVRCMTEAIPFCLLGAYADYAAERIIPETMVFDADTTIEDYGAYRRSEGKSKAPTCASCRWFAQCEGPWREYPELFGWDEFRSVA